MSNVSVAEGRRGDRIKAINRSVRSLEQQIARGAIGANGMADPYLADHVEFCKAEVARLQGEIARLSELGSDDLISELVPEVARDAAIAKDLEDNGPVRFDPLGRGAMPPRAVVVSKTPPPVRRVGGDPAPVQGTLIGANGAPLPPNVVYGYDENFNVVPLSQ
jgi:hypothetical protein